MSAWRITGGPAGGGVAVTADVRLDRPTNTVTVLLDGVTRTFLARRDGDAWQLCEPAGRQPGWMSVTTMRTATGAAELVVEGRRRGVCVAAPGVKAPPPIVTPPMPAVVGRVLVTEGASVEQGDALVTVTAMKMELTLRAPRSGVAHVRVKAGDKVMPGDVLVDVIAAPREGGAG